MKEPYSYHFKTSINNCLYKHFQTPNHQGKDQPQLTNELQQHPYLIGSRQSNILKHNIGVSRGGNCISSLVGVCNTIEDLTMCIKSCNNSVWSRTSCISPCSNNETPVDNWVGSRHVALRIATTSSITGSTSSLLRMVGRGSLSMTSSTINCGWLACACYIILITLIISISVITIKIYNGGICCSFASPGTTTLTKSFTLFSSQVCSWSNFSGKNPYGNEVNPSMAKVRDLMASK